MLVGGIMTAALATPKANPFGADNMFGYMNDKQLVWLSVIAFIFSTAISVRSARIAFTMRQPAGRGFLASHMRLLAIALGVIGIIVAAGNVWAFFIQWLTLLGILVPPIGAIILVDQYLMRAIPEATGEWRRAPSSPGPQVRSSPTSSANMRRNIRRLSRHFLWPASFYGVRKA